MQKKQGISLIVLVITIIVMVILAGAIILTLNNSGIIARASEAVEETNLATVKEVASLAWSEAYADGVRTVEDLADGTKGFETRIKEAFEKNNIDAEKYHLNITTSGVEVKLLSNIWVKDGFTVVKGDKILGIGDTINYDAGVSTYTSGWKILGADEDGNLLIMSAGDVKTNHRLGYESTMTSDAEKLEEGQKDWLNGPAELDSICEVYGYGEGAVGKARSITVEDVNAVTGYDPEIAVWGEGKLWQYGNEVTYEWDTTDTSNIKIKYSGTLNDEAGSAEYSFNAFTWYDDKTGTFSSVAKGVTTNPLPTIKNTTYLYQGRDLTTISATENKEAFEMLFGTYIENGNVYSSNYWLASHVAYTNNNSGWFGLRYVDNYTNINYSGFLWSSSGYPYGSDKGVRAVVTLSSDIELSGSSANGWSY